MNLRRFRSARSRYGWVVFRGEIFVGSPFWDIACCRSKMMIPLYLRWGFLISVFGFFCLKRVFISNLWSGNYIYISLDYRKNRFLVDSYVFRHVEAINLLVFLIGTWNQVLCFSEYHQLLSMTCLLHYTDMLIRSRILNWWPMRSSGSVPQQDFVLILCLPVWYRSQETTCPGSCLLSVKTRLIWCNTINWVKCKYILIEIQYTFWLSGWLNIGMCHWQMFAFLAICISPLRRKDVMILYIHSMYLHAHNIDSRGLRIYSFCFIHSSDIISYIPEN